MGASKKTFLEERLYRMLEHSTYGLFHPEVDPDLWLGRYEEVANGKISNLDKNRSEKYHYTVRFTDENIDEIVEVKK